MNTFANIFFELLFSIAAGSHQQDSIGLQQLLGVLPIFAAKIAILSGCGVEVEKALVQQKFVLAIQRRLLVFGWHRTKHIANLFKNT